MHASLGHCCVVTRILAEKYTDISEAIAELCGAKVISPCPVTSFHDIAVKYTAAHVLLHMNVLSCLVVPFVFFLQ